MMLENLPEQSTNGSAKGGRRRPTPFVDESGRCSGIKHQASISKLLGEYETITLSNYQDYETMGIPLLEHEKVS